jgi:hypothetical protein
MKRVLLAFITLTLFLSCSKSEDKIEFYLLNERIRSSEGIPIVQYAKKMNFPINEEILSEEKANYDTVQKTIIYAGKFSVSNKHLTKEPFITDDEILKVSLSKSEFELSESARKKITMINPSHKFGTQFVICINKEPIITGYFRENASSYIYNWNYMSYVYYKNNFIGTIDKNFVIRQNIGYEKWKPILSNLETHKKLISVLEKSNRLNK